MRLYVVHDEANEVCEGAVSAIQDWARKAGHEVVADNASALGLKSCVGCFGCWVKTPGVCVIKDAEQASLERMVKADILVVLMKTPYGSFSAPIKRVFDRMIPILHPYFRVYRGEMHHVPRYPRKLRLLHIAYGEHSAEEFDTFVELSRAHCDNMGVPFPLKPLDYAGDKAGLVAWLDVEVAR